MLHRSDSPAFRVLGGAVLRARRVARSRLGQLVIVIGFCCVGLVMYGSWLAAHEFHYAGDDHLRCDHDGKDMCHCEHNQTSCEALDARPCDHALVSQCKQHCNWHYQLPNSKMGMLQLNSWPGRCDTCSAHSCEGCATETACKATDPQGLLCRWATHGFADGNGKKSLLVAHYDTGRCESTCSEFFCQGCSHDAESCNNHETCEYDEQSHKCSEKCQPSSCHACSSPESCAQVVVQEEFDELESIWANNDGKQCTWVMDEELCTSTCSASLEMIELGLGCWTCSTRDQCNEWRETGCAWSDASAFCGTVDSVDDEAWGIPKRDAIYFGDVVNPAEHLDLVTHIEGNVILEQLDSWGPGGAPWPPELQQRRAKLWNASKLTNLGLTKDTMLWGMGSQMREFRKLDQVKVIVGNLFVARNAHLKSLHLPKLHLITGDVLFSYNPELELVEWLDEVQIRGCVMYIQTAWNNVTEDCNTKRYRSLWGSENEILRGLPESSCVNGPYHYELRTDEPIDVFVT
jgi:hypothetical protein